MFTGLVESIGTVASLTRSGPAAVLHVDTDLVLDDTKLGDSIAVNGACLTVTALQPGPKTRVSFDVGPESLRVTALGALKQGTRVHLERALRMGDRLGGHIVQGHVDAVGELLARSMAGDTLRLRFSAPHAFLRRSIPKGSVTVSGVSLTINVLDHDAFEVWLIPHTLSSTTFATLRVGDTVNLESDVLGKYVERLLSVPQEGTSKLTMDDLVRHGFA